MGGGTQSFHAITDVLAAIEIGALSAGGYWNRLQDLLYYFLLLLFFLAFLSGLHGRLRFLDDDFFL